jgi:hypothetical protein
MRAVKRSCVVGIWAALACSACHGRTLGAAPAEAGAPGEARRSSPPGSGAPPAGLACLARNYVGRPSWGADGWGLDLPTGARLAWDDGRAKTFDEALAHPDLSDIFRDPYVRGAPEGSRGAPEGSRGPSGAVASRGDPGRIRVDALLRATYGQTRAEVERRLVVVRFHGHDVRVHRRAAAAFEAAGRRVDAAVRAEPAAEALVASLGGTFNWRDIAGGDRLSPHAFGIALDLDPRRSRYWRWGDAAKPAAVPGAIVDAFESEGFIWGGRWSHFDTMHFELRPELLDHACRDARAAPR